MCFKANLQAKTWNNSLSVFNNQIKHYPGTSAMAYVLKYHQTRDIKDLYEAHRIDGSLSTVIFALGHERQKNLRARKEDRYEEALNFYKRLHKDDPNRTTAYIYSMEIYKDIGNEEKLFKTFEECVEVFPKERLFPAYMYMARYYYEKGEYEKALACAIEAEQIFSKDYNTYLLKASIYENQNNFDDAFKEYESALLNCGFVPEILVSLGIVYFKTANYELAAQFFEKAVKINPSSVLAYDFLGNIAALNNAYKTALEKYTMALLIKNNFGQAYFHRAALYLKYGRYDAAEIDANKAKKTGFEVPRSFYEDIKLAKVNSL
jgi:tetratricopeptide (TPR) repeat protein